MSSAIPDSDMLDWLGAQGGLYKWVLQLPADYPGAPVCLFVSRSAASGHRTIREAIAYRMGLSLAKEKRVRKTKDYFVSGRGGWFVVRAANKRVARKIGVKEFGRGGIEELFEATPADVSRYLHQSGKTKLEEEYEG